MATTGERESKPIRVPRWRLTALGLYTPADEADERQAVAWALLGHTVPRALAVRHVVNPWLRRAWWALLMVGAWEGKGSPVRVARALRRVGQWRSRFVPELLELLELGTYVVEPPWARMVERSETRLRVLALEAETHEMRRAIQSDRFT